jgi:hypothetical protein
MDSVHPASPDLVARQLQNGLPQCQPSSGTTLRIATFFVLSIICHALTLHVAPGQYSAVVMFRAVGMIFSPVTAGLYSLMSLGRMGVAWLSILARSIELLHRILAPEKETQFGVPHNLHEKRSNTFELGDIHERRETESMDDAISPTANPRFRLSRSNSVPDLRPSGDRTQSDPSPFQPTSERPNLPERRSDSTTAQSAQSPLQESPLVSTIKLAATMAVHRDRLRQSNGTIDVGSELPHRMHTRAVIAGAVAIHVPRQFRELLRHRNWERLSRREISTEYCRIPESDHAFDEFYQFILPPTATILDKTLRLHPGSVFREASGGLLQLGFGLYQLISDDARYSVARDGMASPFLLVLPYLGMAAVNTTINVIDPPYEAVTVLDISPQAREWLNRLRFGGDFSPRRDTRSTTDSNGTPVRYNIPPHRSITLRMPQRGTTNSGSEARPGTMFRLDTSTPYPSPQLVQSPGSSVPSFLSVPTDQLKWTDFVEWMDFAYGKRIDVSPVDRLYRTAWLTHSIIIGEFIYTTIVGLLIPAVLLAVVGGWTRLRTSNYGLSLAFNLLALFGIPFLQFVLYTHYRLGRMLREFRGRKEHGTFHNPEPSEKQLKQQRKREKARTMPVGWTAPANTRTKAMWWTSMIAMSVGIYFPTRKTIIVGYVILILGTSICEFVLVGINLQRTLECKEPLL